MQLDDAFEESVRDWGGWQNGQRYCAIAAAGDDAR